MNVTIAVPNAIIFVLDPSNKRVLVPDYAPGETIAANSTCVSVATAAEVDGEVSLHLGQPLSDSEKSGCAQIFRGSIETPGRKLAIVTSGFERVLETDVSAFVTRVTISTDAPSSPGVICVNVEGDAS